MKLVSVRECQEYFNMSTHPIFMIWITTQVKDEGNRHW
jgi:hypothetical protein